MIENALEIYLFSKSKTILALLHFLSSINFFRDTSYIAKEVELGD